MKKRLLIINSFAFALTMLVFVPQLMSKNAYKPLLGLPYMFWVGAIITAVFIVLTWQASITYKKVEEEEQQ